MVEKIKVNLSYYVYNLLQHDLESFSYHLKNNEPNKNLFYNTLIKNMYEIRKNKSLSIRNKIDETLSKHLKSDELINELLDQIEEIYNFQNEDHTNRSYGYYISIRPSKSLESIYDEIDEYELKGNTISNYYRNIFNHYAKLPQDERERIIFKDEIKIIENSIKNNKYLNVKLNGNNFEFIPYILTRTNDELYNYIIGCVKKDNNIRAFSLHLYKCQQIIKTNKKYILNQEDINKLEQEIVRGPRNVERRTVISKIKFSDRGKSLFKKLYLNRPTPFKIEDDIYYFNDSQDELYRYFLRFGNTVEIIEPLNFRNQMKKTFKHAYNNYLNN